LSSTGASTAADSDSVRAAAALASAGRHDEVACCGDAPPCCATHGAAAVCILPRVALRVTTVGLATARHDVCILLCLSITLTAAPDQCTSEECGVCPPHDHTSHCLHTARSLGHTELLFDWWFAPGLEVLSLLLCRASS
jgi:hypothetical protein